MHWKHTYPVQYSKMHPHLIRLIFKVNLFCSIDEYDHMEGLNVKGVTTLANLTKATKFK